MPVTYTNRKGVTYYLRRGVTASGKPRYSFAREPGDDPVEVLPEGRTIVESVNGTVSLVKDRPSPILPAEVTTVEAELRRHPKRDNYRVGAKGKIITIYERVGPSADGMAGILREEGLAVLPGAAARLRTMMDRTAQFSPVLRFILANPQQRTFRAERWCYLGSIDDWISIGGE